MQNWTLWAKIRKEQPGNRKKKCTQTFLWLLPARCSRLLRQILCKWNVQYQIWATQTQTIWFSPKIRFQRHQLLDQFTILLMSKIRLRVRIWISIVFCAKSWAKSCLTSSDGFRAVMRMWPEPDLDQSQNLCQSPTSNQEPIFAMIRFWTDRKKYWNKLRNQAKPKFQVRIKLWTNIRFLPSPAFGSRSWTKL